MDYETTGVFDWLNFEPLEGLPEDGLMRAGEILVCYGRTPEEIREVFRLAERELTKVGLKKLKARLI
jgi:hypothetical protein